MGTNEDNKDTRGTFDTISPHKIVLTQSTAGLTNKKNKKNKNIQQRGFASGHPPNY
jgi:hypothetical protein